MVYRKRGDKNTYKEVTKLHVKLSLIKCKNVTTISVKLSPLKSGSQRFY